MIFSCVDLYAPFYIFTLNNLTLWWLISIVDMTELREAKGMSKHTSRCCLAFPERTYMWENKGMQGKGKSLPECEQRHPTGWGPGFPGTGTPKLHSSWARVSIAAVITCGDSSSFSLFIQIHTNNSPGCCRPSTLDWCYITVPHPT